MLSIYCLVHPSIHSSSPNFCTISAMSTITEITGVPDWEKHVASLPPSTLLIISFHAPWAAPCAQMSEVLSTLAADYPVTDPPATSWVSINAEDLIDVSEAYDVTAVPYLVLQRGGKVVETVSGSSAPKVRAAIEAHAKHGGGAAPTAAANGVGKVSGGAAEVARHEEAADPEKEKNELVKRLGVLVKAAPVMLFMKGTPSAPQCGFSRQMVAILRENAVKYGFFNILADDEVRQGLKEFADWPTYPQLWVDGELVGGLDIVSATALSLSPPPHSLPSKRSANIPHQLQVKEEIEGNPDFFKPYSAKSNGETVSAS